MPEEKKPYNKIEYNDRYNAEHYDSFLLRVTKGEKDRLKAHAEKHGESLNEFIKRAISEQICRDTEE